LHRSSDCHVVIAEPISVRFLLLLASVPGFQVARGVGLRIANFTFQQGYI